MEALPDAQPKTFLRAIRLFNTADGGCTFEVGMLPTNIHLDAGHFFGQTAVADYQRKPHPAPRPQYVVTLRGKLRFTVSNGDTFLVEAGIILLAEDTTGLGHEWELLEGEQWERLYIPYVPGAPSHFIPAATP